MVLDDPSAIARVDAAGMLQLIQRFGTMSVEGWRAATGLAIPSRAPSAIVTLGVGGSGIGGDLLRVLLAPTARIPVVVVKDERLPAFVDRTTLVFACSYSGDTAETLAAFAAARAAGAAIIAVTSGGRLAEDARGDECLVVHVPRGLPPRAALPYVLMPMLRVAERLALTDLGEGDVHAAAALLAGLSDRWGPASSAEGNPPKRLAAALHGVFPVVYAASPATEPVAQRWKTQLNENSKTFAAWNAFPELAHNEVVGWDEPGGGWPRHVVMLRDQDEDTRGVKRIEATRQLVLYRARGVTEVWSQGIGRLERLLSLVMFGDFVSAYLAVLQGVDPTPVETIARIRRRVQEGEKRQEGSD
jgi:glucose/mannose-6-phosphate isomerase